MLIDHRSNSISFRSDLSVDQKEEVMDGPYFQVRKRGWHIIPTYIQDDGEFFNTFFSENM